MAEQAKLSSPYPAPPPFYQHFTKHNLAQLRHIQRHAATGEVVGHAAADDTSLSPDLRYLVPPATPDDVKYSSFGVEIDRRAPDPDLATAQIEQLYPTQPAVRLNPQPYLIALARSALTTFLALTGILSQNPTLYEDRAKDLQTIMYNMHHLINHYRPHQARETLILLMQDRVEKVKNEIRAVEEAKGKVSKMLQGLRDGGIEQRLRGGDEHEPDAKSEDQTAIVRKTRQRLAWQALRRELG